MLAYAGLLVDAKMIALFACRRLDQNGNGGANTDNNKSRPKSPIVSVYGRIRYYNRVLLKFGRAPITNVFGDTYRTVSVIPYWELTHRASIVHRGTISYWLHPKSIHRRIFNSYVGSMSSGPNIFRSVALFTVTTPW